MSQPRETNASRKSQSSVHLPPPDISDVSVRKLLSKTGSSSLSMSSRLSQDLDVSSFRISGLSSFENISGLSLPDTSHISSGLLNDGTDIFLSFHSSTSSSKASSRLTTSKLGPSISSVTGLSSHHHGISLTTSGKRSSHMDSKSSRPRKSVPSTFSDENDPSFGISFSDTNKSHTQSDSHQIIRKLTKRIEDLEHNIKNDNEALPDPSVSSKVSAMYLHGNMEQRMTDQFRTLENRLLQKVKGMIDDPSKPVAVEAMAPMAPSMVSDLSFAQESSQHSIIVQLIQDVVDQKLNAELSSLESRLERKLQALVDEKINALPKPSPPPSTAPDRSAQIISTLDQLRQDIAGLDHKIMLEENRVSILEKAFVQSQQSSSDKQAVVSSPQMPEYLPQILRDMVVSELEKRASAFSDQVQKEPMNVAPAAQATQQKASREVMDQRESSIGILSTTEPLKVVVEPKDQMSQSAQAFSAKQQPVTLATNKTPSVPEHLNAEPKAAPTLPMRAAESAPSEKTTSTKSEQTDRRQTSDLPVSEIYPKLSKIKKRLQYLEDAMEELSVGVDKRLDTCLKDIAKEMDEIKEHKPVLVDLEHILEGKVDSHVLEELMRHIATREELEQLVQFVRSNMQSGSPLQEVEEKMEQQTATLREQLKALMAELAQQHGDKMRHDFENKLELMRSMLKNEMKDMNPPPAPTTATGMMEEVLKRPPATPPDLDDWYNLVYNRISTDFDGKMQHLFSELSSCKQAWQMSVRQPFYRCAQWIWKCGYLKYGSAVPWNIESSNTDPTNFRWSADSVNIKIEEGGLYEIAFAFFTKTKPSIQLVVNGESVLSAINSSSYIVHHASGYIMNGEGRVEEGTVTGISLVDFLALPFKSTISLHYHGGRKGLLGHGFLGLRKL